MSDAPDPGIEIFREVTLLPCRRDPDSRTGYSFGAFGPDGTSLPAFEHPWCSATRFDPAAPRAVGRAIYGGLLMDHFGHFLLDAMARLWCIRRHPDLPVVWHAIALPVPHAAWPGWMQQVWRLLGLDRHRHHVLQLPLRFEEIAVPRPGFTNEAMHPLQMAALAVVPPAEMSIGDRVWLSRSALPAQFGRLLGEAELETRLAEQGWTILHPQTMTPAAQAAVFASAAIVAGFAGSAFHAVLLCIAPRARLRLLRRPSVGTLHYDLVARARGLDLAHIEIPLRPTGALHAWTTFEIVDIEAAAETVRALAV